MQLDTAMLSPAWCSTTSPHSASAVTARATAAWAAAAAASAAAHIALALRDVSSGTGLPLHGDQRVPDAVGGLLALVQSGSLLLHLTLCDPPIAAQVEKGCADGHEWGGGVGGKETTGGLRGCV